MSLRAIAAISSAVARFAPVEPAMIVGPRARAGFEGVDFGLDEQRGALGAVDEAVVPSQAGQYAKAIFRKSSVMRQ